MELLVDVLMGLGGASQERSAARDFFGSISMKKRERHLSTALFCLLVSGPLSVVRGLGALDFLQRPRTKPTDYGQLTTDN